MVLACYDDSTFDCALINLRTGIFFAFAIFLEGWSLYDCKYHLNRMRPKKIRRNEAIFGDKLAWNFEEIQRSNGTTIVIDTGKEAWSNRQSNTVATCVEVYIAPG